MYRYIAFAWNQQAAERSSLANILVQRLKSALPEWRCALAAEGLHVYHFGDGNLSARAYLLGQNTGVVLGKVFRRCAEVESDPHELEFNEFVTGTIEETKGRHLIERYWGRYVALLREGDGARLRILRDPTGAMPCLLITFRGIYVICSHVADCETLGLVDNTINWNHIAAYLWFRRFPTNQTGLDSVRQIQAGECIAICPDSKTLTATFYWTPARAHDARVVDDRLQAMRELRTAIQLCVRAWASCYDRILHELSGGLDSAIVLACLHQTSGVTDMICENFFTQCSEGDERRFARMAANRARAELIETPIRSSTMTLDCMLDSTRHVTPMQTILIPEYRSVRERLLKARRIGAVFSGQGGDHLFQRTKTPFVAAEYAWRHGLRPEILRVIMDTSRLTRKPIWSVMATVVTSGLFRWREDPYERLPEPPPLLSEAVCHALDLGNIRHDWVDSATHLPGSKILQILDLIDSQHLCHLPSQHADIVHPLLSQPIIETCLQIPSYHLTYGGMDRALVREAFSGIVPRQIIERTTKGGTSAYVVGTLVKNLASLQEFLLHGLLMREGMLDRAKTEASLTEACLIRDSSLSFPVLSAIQAEAWLRTWIGQSRRIAA
ncbi:MAG: asparagine synthase-related protein [Woeseiaceae bacterium]